MLGSRRPNNPRLPSYDTLYINSSGLNQERLAPLIVALLTEIKEARYRLHRIARAQQPGVYLPPTVLALDETANIAPIPDLPSIISQGGSQGVVVVAVFHHLGQAKARWGADGMGFLTTFQERLVFPGIWERETLEGISVVVGDWDRPVTSYSEDANSADPRRSSYQHSILRQPILPPAEIQAGRPEVPDAALFLQGRAHAWIHTTPYYSCPPWPHLLVMAMERWAAAPADYPQRALPIPELDRVDPKTDVPWLWQAGGQPLRDRYHSARDALRRPVRQPLPY